MPTFLETVEEQFGSRDLYEVLQVDKSAEEADLRRAYRRLSLRVHPDRASPEEVASATEKFQTLGKIYSILTDKDKRAIYDENGTVDEDSSIFDQDRDWSDYWRLLFPKITVEDIKSFEDKYKGSEEEMEDLRRAYLQHEGDMDAIMGEVLCSSVEDEPRYTALLQGWIADGALPDFEKFSAEPEKRKRKRKARFEKEAKEAKKMKLDGEESTGDLSALIKAKQSSL
ncbi:DnaJ homolog subfamily C member 9 [Geodia barretti]|uniref:DnaJ homolog subfamily C member 9 n=1 Tax=Geodia barretti TaxID=519541 RepID=A0AA35X337_GEOBA|nr:DnaJ homolog subfamily C member 9 [Geodia barretti]